MVITPLDPVYPVVFVDAIVVKVRDGQVRNTPFYVVNVYDNPAYAEIREQLKAQMWAEQGRLLDKPHPSQPVPELLSEAEAR